MLLLLVRTTLRSIGTIPLGLSSLKEPVTIHVPDRLATSVLPAGTRQVAVAEWRLGATADPVPPLPWKAFPAAASQIAHWITDQAAQHPQAVILLATRVPQELALGLGIQLAQRRQWPQQVYPVYFEPQDLIVPDLKLGRERLPGLAYVGQDGGTDSVSAAQGHPKQAPVAIPSPTTRA